ncbi:MAG: CPBP family intramembrane metalloprotease [Acidobacteriota bacterium]|nr:CPBP family intramembrane metalloprotease [Acidobacteriota bacterium]
MNLPPGDDDHGGIGAFTDRIRTAFAPTVSSTAATRAIDQPLATQKHLPLRYQLKDDDRGPYLTCVEASNIAVRIERGLSVSASAARKYPKGTIFLDGAAQGEPFMDASKGIYNLDHHEGCVRSFTLSTCEQAMILILKGLDLDDERWEVWANEPDFDTVLAIWLLLNHRRIGGEDPALRRRLMPIVRLQGVIDAHGFELDELTAFPPHLQKATLDTINELRSDELALKAQGVWGTTDLLEFTHSALQQIDDLVYTPGDFEGLREVEELARVRISPHRLAVACHSEAGIYEVEEQLKEVHGDRLGLLILQKDDRTYTLRQVDPFLPTNLDDVYDRLNLLDGAVSGSQRWGGSGDIGGSPRGVGTDLRIDEIVDICRWVFQPPTGGRRLATVGAGLLVTVLALGAVVLAGGAGLLSPPGLLLSTGPEGFRAASLALLGLGLMLVMLGRSRFPGYFGLRRPRRASFLLLLPLTVGAAACGGGWVQGPGLELAGISGVAPWWMTVAVIAGAAGIELLLRGALHGLLMTAYPVHLNGRPSISTPNLVSASVYAAAVGLCFLPTPWLSVAGSAAGVWAVWMAAALLMGLVLGVVRERWRSVWASVTLQALTAAFIWFVFA